METSKIVMIIRVIALALLFVASCFSIDAQIIKTLSIQEEAPVTELPKESCLDMNGNECALLHVVGFKSGSLLFEGNVISQTYEHGDYYVFVPARTKRVRAKHPDYWATEISFQDFGAFLRGGVCYKVLLKAEKIEETVIDISAKKNEIVVSFLAKPFDADIFVDGSLLGKTPCVSKKIKAGSHHVRITKDGYLDLDTTFFVDKGNTYTIKELLPHLENVIFHSNAPIGEVWIDDKKVGELNNSSLQVSTGYHRTRLVAPGYYEEDSYVLIRPGQTSVSFNLRPKFQGKRSVIVNGQPVQLSAENLPSYRDLYRGKFPNEIVPSKVRQGYLVALSIENNSPITATYPYLEIRDYSDITFELDDLSAKLQNADNYYKYGVDRFVQKDYINAYRWFRAAFEIDGEISSLTKELSALCRMSFNSSLVIPNRTVATRYATLSICEEPEFTFTYGWILEKGKFYPQDYIAAIEKYKNAAIYGDRSALWNLAWIYEQGYGVDKNVELASYFYKLASESFARDPYLVEGCRYSIESKLYRISPVDLYEMSKSANCDNLGAYRQEAVNAGNINAIKEGTGTGNARYICYTPNGNAEMFKKIASHYCFSQIDSCIYYLQEAVVLNDREAVDLLAAVKIVKTGICRFSLFFDGPEVPISLTLNDNQTDWKNNGDIIEVNIRDNASKLNKSADTITKRLCFGCTFPDGNKRNKTGTLVLRYAEKFAENSMRVILGDNTQEQVRIIIK